MALAYNRPPRPRRLEEAPPRRSSSLGRDPKHAAFYEEISELKGRLAQEESQAVRWRAHALDLDGRGELREEGRGDSAPCRPAQPAQVAFRPPQTPPEQLKKSEQEAEARLRIRFRAEMASELAEERELLAVQRKSDTKNEANAEEQIIEAEERQKIELCARFQTELSQQSELQEAQLRSCFKADLDGVEQKWASELADCEGELAARASRDQKAEGAVEEHWEHRLAEQLADCEARIASNVAEHDASDENRVAEFRHQQEEMECRLESYVQKMSSQEATLHERAEESIRQLEDREAQAELLLSDELASHEEQNRQNASRSMELEKRLASVEASLSEQREEQEERGAELAAQKEQHMHESLSIELLEARLQEQLDAAQQVLAEQYENRSEAYQEDCLRAMAKERSELASKLSSAEALERGRCQQESKAQLAQEKSRLQMNMEEQLQDALAKQARPQSVEIEIQTELAAAATGEDMQLVEAALLDTLRAECEEKQEELVRAGRAASVLKEEVATARRRGLPPRRSEAGDVDGQAAELQKLLQLAHGENCGLREEIHEMAKSIRTQQEEIELLEEKVLDTLTGMREGSSRSRSVPGKPTGGSVFGRDTPPGSRQPGDIKRLPPQPKPRYASHER
eukprot:gnl/TRDRNA2_/TRDRNA2_36467_c0_seq1.p1 gnl/TRDRNA2_/TRDRNA2_36467_c0~~gnl/TRDRNA2_/TRDRNA2_36467_c0_seq1.p1  ORF type:complete len:631 (+),score=164.37 gnl/TRDRNA2_/TRDRNA2_36467_c0_seq1:123-2015(+)